MEILINGKPVEVKEGITVDEIPAVTGIKAEGIAIAVENRVIRKPEWCSTKLNNGDRVTVIKAVCGG